MKEIEKKRLDANTTGWISNELKSHFLRILINEMMSQPVGFTFSSVLFNDFINDLNEDRKYMYITFAEDTKLQRIRNIC